MVTLTPQAIIGLLLLFMLGLFLFLALRQEKNVHSIFDYHLYGNDLKVRRFSASLIATNASLSGAFVLILYYGFLYGPWVFPFVWAFWIMTELTSAWTIHRTELVMQGCHGGWYQNRATLHQFIGLVFHSPRSRMYAGWLSLVAYLGLMAAEVVLAMHLTTFVLPNHGMLGPFCIVAGIMLAILIYNVLSGFRGTVQTDVAQWTIISVMIVIVACFVVSKFGTMWSEYPQFFNSPSGPSLKFLFNPDRNGYPLYISFLASNIIFWGLWWPGAMDQWQRCAAARTPRVSLEKTWGTIGMVPVLYFGVLSAVFVGAGVWLRVSSPDAVPSPDFLRNVAENVQAWGMVSLGPAASKILVSLVVAGLLCAAMATIDGYVMTASQTFFVDIAHYRKGATLVDLAAADKDKMLLRKSRAFTIFIPPLVVLLAGVFTLASDVYPLIYFAFAFMFALLPPLFAGLKGWGRAEAARACERSLIAGGICALAGAIVIEVSLEAALRANSLFWINAWYQAVYWWSAVVAAVGSLVLWLNWPKSLKSQSE